MLDEPLVAPFVAVDVVFFLSCDWVSFVSLLLLASVDLLLRLSTSLSLALLLLWVDSFFLASVVVVLATCRALLLWLFLTIKTPPTSASVNTVPTTTYPIIDPCCFIAKPSFTLLFLLYRNRSQNATHELHKSPIVPHLSLHPSQSSPRLDTSHHPLGIASALCYTNHDAYNTRTNHNLHLCQIMRSNHCFARRFACR